MNKAEQLAAAVAAHIAPRIPVSVDLWSAVEIAAYLKKNERTVAEKLVYTVGFPRPIRLPSETGKRGSHPLWKAREVIAWAESHQEAA